METLIVFGVIGLAATYLGRKALRTVGSAKDDGCGAGCGCDSVKH